MPWSCEQYATHVDPLHQSDVGAISGEYGCAKRWSLRKSAGERKSESSAWGPVVLGLAVHAVIARYAALHAERIVAGEAPDREGVAARVHGMIIEASGGEPVDWGRGDLPGAISDGVAMIMLACELIHERASAIEAAEAPFALQVGDAWVVGSVDLIYRDRTGQLSLLDWKTGTRKPGATTLRHGTQLGTYALALRDGMFFPGLSDDQVEEALALGTDSHVWQRLARTRGKRFGAWPSEMGIAQLRAYEVYQRRSTRTITDAAEAAMYGVSVGEKYTFQAGDRKGPAWYPSPRTEAEAPRTAHTIASTVRLVRSGLVGSLETISDQTCPRCEHRDRCLSDGYQLAGAPSGLVQLGATGLESLGGAAPA